jgi:hypothetical protein
MSKTEKILSGLTEQNSPAKFNGRKGFWVQAEAVFIEGENLTYAISDYRDAFAERRIACHHNFACPVIVEGIFLKHMTDEQIKEARKEIKL